MQFKHYSAVKYRSKAILGTFTLVGSFDSESLIVGSDMLFPNAPFAFSGESEKEKKYYIVKYKQ